MKGVFGLAFGKRQRTSDLRVNPVGLDPVGNQRTQETANRYRQPAQVSFFHVTHLTLSSSDRDVSEGGPRVDALLVVIIRLPVGHLVKNSLADAGREPPSTIVKCAFVQFALVCVGRVAKPSLRSLQRGRREKPLPAPLPGMPGSSNTTRHRLHNRTPTPNTNPSLAPGMNQFNTPRRPRSRQPSHPSCKVATPLTIRTLNSASPTSIDWSTGRWVQGFEGVQNRTICVQQTAYPAISGHVNIRRYGRTVRNGVVTLRDRLGGLTVR